jgi:hypothetical protein
MGLLLTGTLSGPYCPQLLPKVSQDLFTAFVLSQFERPLITSLEGKEAEMTDV